MSLVWVRRFEAQQDVDASEEDDNDRVEAANDDDDPAAANNSIARVARDPGDVLVDRCVARVTTWVTYHAKGHREGTRRTVETLEELLDLACAELHLRFELVTSDEQLREARDRYLTPRERAFVNLDREIRLKNAYVVRTPAENIALIDARGTRQYATWFSKWREVAFFIAALEAKESANAAVDLDILRHNKRSEPLIDQVAAALAFYDPLFVPLLHSHGLLKNNKKSAPSASVPRITDVADFITKALPFGPSLHSTLCAVARHQRAPIIVIEAKPAAGARKSIAAPRLHAFTATSNPAARRRQIVIEKNARIPARSIITRLFLGSEEPKTPIRECLSWWDSAISDRFNPEPMFVDAKQAGPDRVLALCSLEH